MTFSFVIYFVTNSADYFFPYRLLSFRFLHKSETADQPDHVPSTGTSNNRVGNIWGIRRVG